MIAIRLGLYLSLMMSLGLAAFPLYSLRPDKRTEYRVLPLRKPPTFWLILAFALSVIGLLLLVANMMGTSIVSVDWEAIRPILTETPIGTAWLIRIVAIIVAIYMTFLSKISVSEKLVGVALASAVALASLVWTGHAGATPGLLGAVHASSDILHMLAGAIWLGSILGLLRLLRPPGAEFPADCLALAHRSLDTFSRVGTLCVAIIIVTGLVNSQILVGIGNISEIFSTVYGQLLVLKLLLVGVMLLLAANNRWRLTPDLGSALSNGSGSTAIAALRISLLSEAAAGVLVLGLVAWLGMLEPTVSSIGS